jgi:carboxylesterase type B
LWTGSILSSIAAAKPYKFDAAQVNRPYYRLAEAAGCISNQTTFECLIDAPFETLLNASNIIAGSELYGVPPFEPVVDGDYIPASPSQLYLKSHINGRFALIGNQANEGFDFTLQFATAQFPLAINTSEALEAFIAYEYPLLSKSARNEVISQYPASSIIGS